MELKIGNKNFQGLINSVCATIFLGKHQKNPASHHTILQRIEHSLKIQLPTEYFLRVQFSGEMWALGEFLALLLRDL